MKRNKLTSLLENYHPVDPAEKKFKDEILFFIRKHEDCFERSLEVGHITASAWLVNKDNTHALLMHHFKLDKWFQVGGHCDGNPDVLKVAIKEAQEESGIQHIAAVEETIFDIDIHLIPINKREKEHYHYDIRFLLQVQSDEQVVQNQESKELRWIGKADPLPTDNLSVMRMFNKWIAYN